LAWHHAPACMESPKAYGITEGAFLRLDSIRCSASIPYRLRRIPSARTASDSIRAYGVICKAFALLFL
jgi:hypothetical protein